MSDEEKEAIALLIVFNLANNLQHISEKEFADIKKANRIILNLIEKQQKELEQEKEKNKQFKDIEQQICNEVLIDTSSKEFMEKYIPKYKIRAKIEELKNDEKNIREKKKNSYDYDRSKSRLQAYLTKTNEMIKRLKELLEE